MKNKRYHIPIVIGFCLLISCGFKPNYDIHVIAGKEYHINKSTQVIFNGRQIGQISQITSFGSNEILVDVRLSKKESIPKDSHVGYLENILGDTFIDISSEVDSDKETTFYLAADDTLHMSGGRKLDEPGKVNLVDRLKSFRSVVDSLVKADSSK